jgi:hypothetical protein
MSTHIKDVYICYNGADLDWVRKLAEHIESETIDGLPTSRNLSAFFDRWDIGPGQSLIDRMNEGMRVSRHLITVLSPEFLKADWPRFEWKNIVAQNPNNVGERIIPLRLRDLSIDGTERIELCAPFRDLRYVDFRKASDFRRSFHELIRRIRNLPPERGRKLAPITGRAAILPNSQLPDVSWLPDKVSELLLSNLFAVKSLPAQVWSGETKYRKNKEVWEVIPKAEPFILREGRLYSFGDLRSEKIALRAAVSENYIRSESYYDWLLRADRKTWLIALLNASLAKHLRRKKIFRDEKGRYFFVPNMDGTDRKFSVPSGRVRTVAAKKGQLENPFWVHYAAKMRFRVLGDSLFLAVEPVFLFTADGAVSIKGKNAGRLSLQWGGKQQNPHILRDLLFWGNVLSGGGGTISIFTGSRKIAVDAMPACSRVECGVAFDTIKIRALLEQADNVLNEVAENGRADNEDEDEAEQESE